MNNYKNWFRIKNLADFYFNLPTGRNSELDIGNVI